MAWLRTPADRDPGRLLVHLLDVLRGAVPGLGAVLGDRLAAPERVDVAAATRTLAGELRRLLDPLTLAVDDAEQLEGTPAESEGSRALRLGTIDLSVNGGAQHA